MTLSRTDLATCLPTDGSLWRSLTIAAAVGSGAMGGVFFTFSAFVMPALRRLPSAQGIAAMQSINVTAVRPALMTLLFGTGALTLLIGGYAVTHWGDRRSALLLAGAGLYLVGSVVITAAVNVPLNDTLAVLDPAGGGSVRDWDHFLTRWTLANHLRTVLTLAGAGVLTAALRA